MPCACRHHVGATYRKLGKQSALIGAFAYHGSGCAAWAAIIISNRGKTSSGGALIAPSGGAA